MSATIASEHLAKAAKHYEEAARQYRKAAKHEDHCCAHGADRHAVIGAEEATLAHGHVDEAASETNAAMVR